MGPYLHYSYSNQAIHYIILCSVNTMAVQYVEEVVDVRGLTRV